MTRTFGPDFTRKLFALTPETWSGPVESGYGFIRAHFGVAARAIAAVRRGGTQVLDEWRYEQEKAAKERDLAELRKRA